MAKKLELKAAERKAAVSSNPELLELKERLGKIEVTVNQIIGESKRKSSDVQSDSNRLQAAQPKLDSVVDKQEASKTAVARTEVTGTRGSSDDQDCTKKGVPSQDPKK